MKVQLSEYFKVSSKFRLESKKQHITYSRHTELPCPSGISTQTLDNLKLRTHKKNNFY